MELIQNNPYRVAGIFAGAKESELQKQKSKIIKYASIGKEISSELDFSFLNKLQRNENEIKKAFSCIEQNHDKIRNALFWFLNASPFDNTAIEYLKNGDYEKAVEIWEKVTKDKDVNFKNCSCFNNLGTLKLLGNSFDEIKEGIEAKIQLVESNSFVHFINIVADGTYSVNNQKQIEILIDDLLSQLKNKFSQSDIINLLDNCNGSTQNYLLKKITEEQVFKIENLIDSTKSKRKENRKNGYKYGLNLFVNCKDDLVSLKKVFGESDLKYKILADNLAKEILQCGIDYFKEWENTKDPTEEGLKLLKYAKSIAVSTQLLERIDSNIEGMMEFKDKEINQAIAILSSIKMTYDKAISEIDAQVSAMLMRMSYNETINYSKVNRMKASCLNWNKVVDVVSEGISVNDVEMIQRCPNQSKVSEYRNLVDFLIGKLGPIQINQVKHICYWKDVRAAQAKSTAKKVGKTISAATEGCYIATMAYGDYEHPQVLKLRTFRDDFLRQSYFGRKFIELYYIYSPFIVGKLKDKPKTNEIIRTLLDQLIKIIRK
ncbi:MAG: CFI-box-CTERM domain-containing protein [bacterium]